jgi:glycerophosphoryl diester phosphodiesterase
VVEFLRTHRKPDVLIGTGSVRALRTLRDETPWAIRLLSVGNAGQLEQLKRNRQVLDLIDGVTIRHTLVAPAAGWLEEQGLIVLAWTVNSVRLLNELVRMGVDAVTTDNLAILELLGGGRQGEVAVAELVRSRRP